MGFYVKFKFFKLELIISVAWSTSQDIAKTGTIDPWVYVAERHMRQLDEISTEELGIKAFGVAPEFQDWQFSRRVRHVMNTLGFELCLVAPGKRAWRRKTF